MELEEHIPTDSERKQDSANTAVRILLDVLSGQGVGGAIISPGSRNAPLIMGLRARDEIEKWIVPDERMAAFMALGIAMVKQKPMILVCTSGTALYNYAPAIAEAFYQNVPLIVISADRPKEWIDQDDSQTLIQPGALGKIVKKSFDIPVIRSADKDELWFVNRIANEAFCLVNTGRKGPVHINIQLAAPLNELVDKEGNSQRLFKVVENRSPLPYAEMDRLGAELADRKVLLTAGFMPVSEQMQKAVRAFAKLPNVAVMAETLSNLHLDPEVYAIDSTFPIIRPEQIPELRPDTVISIGGSLVSRMLKTFLRENPPAELWTLGDTPCGTDTFQCLTTNFAVSPAPFIKALASAAGHHQRKMTSTPPQYREDWRRIKRAALGRHDSYVAESGWSELMALDYIFKRADLNDNVFLSNGTVVRYAQLCTRRLPHLTLGCRGVSGIDGTNASALGAAMAYKGRTILITGDLSFSYCTEILGSPYFPDNFCVIVINNRGGGIFRFVANTRSLPEREKYFGADPLVPIEGLCKTYGRSYRRAESNEELEEGISSLISEGGVLEICAPAEHSAEILNNYFKS